MLKHRYYVSSKEQKIQNCQNSGDIPSTPDSARHPSRMNKCSLSQSPAKAGPVLWTRFGHRGVRKSQVSRDAMKDISLSAHENNIVWCRKCPGPDTAKASKGPGREEIELKKPVPVSRHKGRGSSHQRFVEFQGDVSLSCFNVSNSQTVHLLEKR